MAEKFSGRLPHQLRVASLIQASLIGFAVLVVEVRAGQLWTHWFTLSQKLIWAVVFLFAVATLLNFITPSKKERALWFPIAAVLLMSSFFVAMN